jgi:hypothetical protein
VLTCSDTCEWVAAAECTDEGECEPGTLSRTSEGCPAGQTREVECSDACEFVEVEPCVSDSCTTPGVTETVSCGDCGTVSRFCSGDRVWVYGLCEGEGECSPGEIGSVECGRCGTQAAGCNEGCRWIVTGECLGEGECSPGEAVTTREGCPEGQVRRLECSDACELEEVAPCADVTTADVMLLVDVTGSHAEEVAALARVLVTDLVTPLLADGLFVGVATYADFPVSPYGDRGDRPFVGLLEPTDSLSTITSTIESLRGASGGDLPEAGVEALNVLTGGAVHPAIDHPMTCSTGREAGGCWRPGLPRVIAVLTDAPDHNGPSAASGGGLFSPYDTRLFTTAPAEWPGVRDALIEGGYGIFIRLSPRATDEARTQARTMITDLGQPESHVGAFTADGAPSFDDLRALIEAYVGL